MRSLNISFLVLSVLTLSACQTSSLSDAEKAPVPKTATAFTGDLKEIDTEKSVLSFVGRSNVINHEGTFNAYTAAVTLDSSEPANLEKATIAAEIDVSSIETDSEGLTGHLQRDDFFNAEQYPKITFVSTRIVHTTANFYEVTGDLTIKGTTKPIAFTAEITNEYLTAQFDLPRQEFGIGNDAYGNKLLETTVPVNVKLVFKS
jgi:polyisoprenoid-binding protein YceI